MTQFKITRFAGLLLLILGCSPWLSCSDDEDDTRLPSFDEMTITPAQDVYHVGDRITCSIRMTSPASSNLKKATWWFYASWMFAGDEDVDFQESENNVFTSSTITLTKAGNQTLYFFGRCEYPKFDFRKVEIAKTIKVVE